MLCAVLREKMLMMTMFDICNDNVGVVVVAIISSYYVNKYNVNGIWKIFQMLKINAHETYLYILFRKLENCFFRKY